MHQTTLSRHLAVLVVAASLALVPAAAQARPAGMAKEHSVTLSLPQRAGLAFGNLWLTLASLWANEGASIDPSGQPAPPSGGGSQAPSDHGGSIDPDGLISDSGGSIGIKG